MTVKHTLYVQLSQPTENHLLEWESQPETGFSYPPPFGILEGLLFWYKKDWLLPPALYKKVKQEMNPHQQGLTIPAAKV